MGDRNIASKATWHIVEVRRVLFGFRWLSPSNPRRPTGYILAILRIANDGPRSNPTSPSRFPCFLPVAPFSQALEPALAQRGQKPGREFRLRLVFGRSIVRRLCGI